MGRPPTNPLGVPAGPIGAAPLLPAIEQLRVLSSGQWEDVTLEWAHSLKNNYPFVERCGGAGDLGCDIVAYESRDEKSAWRNYQCKHYDHPLMPSEISIELGKLCYYVFQGEYTAPLEYLFVAPQGVGNKLSRLFRNPEGLRELLIKKWDSNCREKITSTKCIELSGEFLAFVESFDFSIVDYVRPMDLLEQHATTRWHTVRFGGALPTRAKITIPPLEDETFESVYIVQLLLAYSEHKGTRLDAKSLLGHDVLHSHLLRSRERFFNAEALRNFSRDNLPQGQFEALQDEFYDGIIDNVEDIKHADGFERVKTTTSIAQQLNPANNALREVLSTRDKAGICHQLTNDGRVKWVRQ